MKDEDLLDHNLEELRFLPALSRYSFLQRSMAATKKDSSVYFQHPLIDERSKPITFIDYKQFKEPIVYTDIKEEHSTSQKQQKSEFVETEPVPARYYSKNACKNIIKKCLRSIQIKAYQDKLREICQSNGNSFQDFYDNIMGHLQAVSGPSALRILLKNRLIGGIFREYLEWYLKERYIREALRAGHMNNLKVYIEYKNKELIRILRE